MDAQLLYGIGFILTFGILIGSNLKGVKMTRTYDFDAWDGDGEPIEIVLFGQEWQLPGVGQIPARDMLRSQRKALEMSRLAKEHGIDDLDAEDDLPVELVEPMLELYQIQQNMYLGQENVEAWLERDISEPRLKAILAWARAQHAEDAPEDDEPVGEAT